MVVVHLTLNNTIGAAFLGNIFASILYGVTCLQTFVYYQKSRKDSIAFRLVIGFLWILDTFHLALVTHALFYYLIQNFGNVPALASTTWSILVQIYVTAISDLIVRTIYARRVWIITKHNILLTLVIGLTSLTSSVTAIAFATKGFAEVTFENLPHNSYLMNTSLACAVAADATIATTLCISLSQSRTGFKKMDTVLNTLIIYIINSCLLTTLCSVVCLITYAIVPTELIFLGIYFCLSKLFLNSLLAMLNGRSVLQERASGFSTGGLAQFAQTSAQPSTQPTFQRSSFASNQVANSFEEIQPKRSKLALNAV